MANPRAFLNMTTLPDGNVLVTGGDRTRDLTTAAGSAGYGAGFAVGTPDAAGVSSVVLTAPAALTHNFNENARYVPLSFTAGAGGLQVTAPANANLAPPGPYLLWIVNGNGVPSVARWITIS
jgi:Galactose oxidase-like, Early set domain